MLVFIASLLFSTLGLTWGIFALASQLPPEPWKTPIGVMARILPSLQALQGTEGRKDTKRIAMLGDSTVDYYPRGEKIPDRLQQALERSAPAGPSIKVTNLAFLALGPTAYYFLADRIVASRPDLIVWEVSLTHASERWRRSLPRPELAGWMAPDRIPKTLTMPIEDIGLTADALLLYEWIVRSGRWEQWQALLINLSRVGRVRGLFEEWLSAYTERRPEKRFAVVAALNYVQNLREIGNPDRHNRRGEIEHFGSVLGGIEATHPTLRFIAETVRFFSDAGIPVLVYLNPVNIEHLEKLGVIENETFQLSLDAYRNAAVDNGAFFVDFHALFPDHYFDDLAGHFRHDQEVEAQTELAQSLAKFISKRHLLDDAPLGRGRRD
jgi:hypothetical protein